MPYGDSALPPYLSDLAGVQRGMKKNSAGRAGGAGSSMPNGFQAAFRECFGAVLPGLPRRRGRRPRVPLAQLLPALVFHCMNAAGPLAEPFPPLFAAPFADSSFSERRARLPWEVFAEWLRLGLRPRAQAATQPAAFWRGWRLVALDGTPFSLTHHAAGPSHHAQGPNPARARGLRQAHHRRPAGTGPASSAGRRPRPARPVGVGAGPGVVGSDARARIAAGRPVAWGCRVGRGGAGGG